LVKEENTRVFSSIELMTQILLWFGYYIYSPHSEDRFEKDLKLNHFLLVLIQSFLVLVIHNENYFLECFIFIFALAASKPSFQFSYTSL
jgi:hypothetical protein